MYKTVYNKKSMVILKVFNSYIYVIEALIIEKAYQKISTRLGSDT